MGSHRLALTLAAVTALAVSTFPTGPTGAALAGEQPTTGLDALADADLEVVVKVEQRPLSQLFQTLELASGTEFRLQDGLGCELVDVNEGPVRLATLLEALGRSAGLRYGVLAPRVVEVRKVFLPGPEVVPPRRIWNVAPKYPEEARARKLEGSVIAQVVIDRFGNVDDVTVLRTVPEGETTFAESAVEALRKWRYEPALRSGLPVDVYFTVIMDFSLD